LFSFAEVILNSSSCPKFLTLSVSDGSRWDDKLCLDLGVICDNDEPGLGLDSLAGDDAFPDASLSLASTNPFNSSLWFANPLWLATSSSSSISCASCFGVIALVMRSFTSEYFVSVVRISGAESMLGLPSRDAPWPLSPAAAAGPGSCQVCLFNTRIWLRSKLPRNPLWLLQLLHYRV